MTMLARALVDSNIVIDWLRGVPEAATELRRYRHVCASIITRIEVLAGVAPSGHERVAELMAPIEFMPLDIETADLAAAIRYQRRIKVPGAIIQATAQRHQLMLVTRNTKDFPASLPGVRVPYQVT